jgi:hypothetical protein
MSCNSKGNSCSCGCNAVCNPALWSKKKKISVLEQSLECLEKKSEEIKDSIKELKG